MGKRVSGKRMDGARLERIALPMRVDDALSGALSVPLADKPKQRKARKV